MVEQVHEVGFDRGRRSWGVCEGRLYGWRYWCWLEVREIVICRSDTISRRKDEKRQFRTIQRNCRKSLVSRWYWRGSSRRSEIVVEIKQADCRGGRSRGGGRCGSLFGSTAGTGRIWRSRAAGGTRANLVTTGVVLFVLASAAAIIVVAGPASTTATPIMRGRVAVVI